MALPSDPPRPRPNLSQRTEPVLLVLAAGMGSRYGGLKQIDSVGPSGETLLDYSIFHAREAGFHRIVFLIRKEIEATFAETVLARLPSDIDFSLAYQETTALPHGSDAPVGREKPWGTGHAIWCARGQIDAPFLVVNADDYYGADAFRKIAGFFSNASPSGNPMRATMVAYNLSKTLSESGGVSRGICSSVVREDGAGELLRSVEEFSSIRRGSDGEIAGRSPDGEVMRLAPDAPASMNFWGFFPDIFPVLEELFADFLRNLRQPKTDEFYIPSAVDTLLRREEIEVSLLRTDADWLGVTYREDRESVRLAFAALIEKGIVPSPIFSSGMPSPGAVRQREPASGFGLPSSGSAR